MKFRFLGFFPWTVSKLFFVPCLLHDNENDLYNNDNDDDEEDAKDYLSYPIRSCRNVT